MARTAVLDEVILEVLRRDNIELVANLGAGLDTRPYRLELPSPLRWIEVDLPGIVDYKNDRLVGEQPGYVIDRFGIDLSDPAARTRTLRQVLSDRPSLIITEGLVPYLSPESVQELATELHGFSQVRCWWLDLVSPFLLRLGNRFGGRKLERADAVGRFAPDEGADFFRQFGWRPVELRSLWLEQRRLGREPLPMHVAWTVSPRGFRRVLEEISTLVLLKRG